MLLWVSLASISFITALLNQKGTTVTSKPDRHISHMPLPTNITNTEHADTDNYQYFKLDANLKATLETPLSYTRNQTYKSFQQKLSSQQS